VPKIWALVFASLPSFVAAVLDSRSRTQISELHALPLVCETVMLVQHDARVVVVMVDFGGSRIGVYHALQLWNLHQL
jgi:hypothetical protein